MSLCERFPALDPLSIRRYKAREVFTLIKRYRRYGKKKEKEAAKPKTKVIRRPAGDDWF